jgi:hypothetical protein
MSKNIKSPDVYVKRVGAITVFLAGGITGCPDWQREMEAKLKHTPYVTLNPRRDGEFNTMNPEWGVQQIEWENWHLDRAEYILFWFPKEGMCMITLFELGKCLAGGKKVVIGCDPEYLREFDVRTQSRLMRPNIPIAKTLDELAMNLVTLVAHYETEKEYVHD